jgi:hypothetical protein
VEAIRGSTKVALVAEEWNDSMCREKTIVVKVSRLHPVCFAVRRASVVAPPDAPGLS